MTSTETAARPAPLMLAGQTHAAPGPHDLSGMYLAHHAFRRDLRRFAAAARNTPLDDAAAWQASGWLVRGLGTGAAAHASEQAPAPLSS